MSNFEYQRGFCLKNGTIRFRSKTTLPPHENKPYKYFFLQITVKESFWTKVFNSNKAIWPWQDERDNDVLLIEEQIEKDAAAMLREDLKTKLFKRTMKLAKKYFSEEDYLTLQLYVDGSYTQQEIADKLNISRPTICLRLNPDRPNSILFRLKELTSNDKICKSILKQLMNNIQRDFK
jgi:predicted DNA-binding protein YlxM (UPF0122 family)